MQGLRWLGVNELDLTIILVGPPPTRAGLQITDDYVDRPLGLLEWVIGVACLRWRRQVMLIAAVLRLWVLMSPVIMAVVVTAATPIVTTVVVIVT
jgi:hypothetical protein